MIGFNIYFLLTLFLVSGMVLSVWLKKLTLLGALAGGICAVLVFTGSGFTGIFMMTAFFVAGTAATAWKKKEKHEYGTIDADHAGRKASQVLANAGVAAIAGALAFVFPQFKALCAVVIAACFSSATADTLASELGTVYGKRFFNIISWKPDQRGLDGVISLEGTLFGILGSVAIAIIYAVGKGCSWWMVFLLVLAGTAGNLADSVLGALLERKGLLKNDAVNFLSTLIAALVAVILLLAKSFL